MAVITCMGQSSSTWTRAFDLVTYDLHQESQLRSGNPEPTIKGIDVLQSCPLLRPGHSYRLKQHFQVEPAGRAYIQIRFLNRRGVEVGLTILKNGEEEFTCPADSFTYTLTLYSAGCHTVEFYKLSLYSLDKPQTIHLSDEPRGFYAKERYPSDIAFVKHLIRGLKEEGAE